MARPARGHTEVAADKPATGLLIDWLEAREEFAAVSPLGHRLVHGIGTSSPESSHRRSGSRAERTTSVIGLTATKEVVSDTAPLAALSPDVDADSLDQRRENGTALT